MKKILPFLFLILILTAFQIKEKEVFICMTTSSKTYHIKKDCRGLEKCKYKVKKITEKKAKNVGRNLCQIEKKQ